MRALCPFFAACLIGCVEPGQYGGPIPVDPAGTLARLESLCAIAQQPVCGALAGAEDAGTAEDARAPDMETTPDADSCASALAVWRRLDRPRH